MIKAEHNKWAELIFYSYLKRLLKKSFLDFRLVNQLPAIDKTKSILITPNHFSWWDGFFVYWLNRNLIKRKLYVMMLEEQLKRYWFFQKVGCFSIDLNDNRKMITSLKYSIDLLSKTGNLVTLYPQGEIQPFNKSNIELKDGVSFLAKSCFTEFQILPIAFKIDFTKEKLPVIYGRFGNVLSSKQAAIYSQLYKEEFINNLNNLKKETEPISYKSLFDK